LFATKELGIERLKQNARDLKLDGKAFDKCLESGEQAGIVQAEVEEAASVGVQGTPSFLLNGRFFSGNLSYESLRDLVREELAASARQKEIARK